MMLRFKRFSTNDIVHINPKTIDSFVEGKMNAMPVTTIYTASGASHLVFDADREVAKKIGNYLRAEAQRETVEQLFDHAIKCIDRVFQGSPQHAAILPGFCSAGEDKFEAIVRLARAYLLLKNSHKK